MTKYYNVIVTDEAGNETILFNRPDIEEVALTFDQNMQPFVAFVEGGQAKFWFYDPDTQDHVFQDLPADAVSPRCTLDDKRYFASSYSDIILAYLRNGDLYYRLQRDKYVTEYLLKNNVGDFLAIVGGTNNNRLRFDIGENPTP